MKRGDRNRGGNNADGERPNGPTKRQVQGNIEVRGTIQASLPTDLVDEYRLAAQRAEAREDRRFRLETTSLIVAAVGTLLTLVLAIAALLGNYIARESLVTTQRAFITLVEIKANRTTFKDHPESTILTFRAFWKNSGTTPATNSVSLFSTSQNLASLTNDQFASNDPLPLAASGGPVAPKGTILPPV